MFRSIFEATPYPARVCVNSCGFAGAGACGWVRGGVRDAAQNKMRTEIRKMELAEEQVRLGRMTRTNDSDE